MKKFLYNTSVVVVILSLLTSLAAPVVAAETKQPSELEIVEIAEKYISLLNRNIFLYENNDTLSLTLANPSTQSLLQSVRTNSAESVQNEAMFSSLISNINYVEDVAKYSRYANQKMGITRKDYEAQYECLKVSVEDNFATVKIGESISFTYTDDPLNVEPSYMSTAYDVKLMNVNNEWFVVDVTNDYALSDISKEVKFDLAAEIASLDNTYKTNQIEDTNYSVEAYKEDIENIEVEENHIMTQEEIDEWVSYPSVQEKRTLSSYVTSNANSITSEPSSAMATTSNSYVIFQPDMAKQYAWTYWWDDIDFGKNKWVGVNKDKWRNAAIFGDYGSTGGNCSNFVSQVAWAGLGGSNTEDAVKYSLAPLTGSWTRHKDAFRSCNSFADYVASLRSNASLSGPITEHYDFQTNKSPSAQDSNYATILPGSILHVYNGSTHNQKGHAIYCLRVTGGQWSNVYYAANSDSAYNLRINDSNTNSFWSNTTEIRIEHIVAYRDAISCAHKYAAYNDFTCETCDFVRVVALQRTPTNHMGITKNTTRTVGGEVRALSSSTTGSMSTFSCYQLAMCVTAPDGTSTWYSKQNSYYLSQSVQFNQEGIWTIQFDARDRNPSNTESEKISYTFKIRVVDYGAIATSSSGWEGN